MKKIIVLLVAVVITMSLALVACNTEKKLTIKFDTQGGSSVTDIVVDKNNPYKAPTDPTKEGFTFGGWHTDKAGTKPWIYNDKAVGIIRVYALWIENKHVATTSQQLVDYLASDYAKGAKLYIEGEIDLSSVELTDVHAKKAYLVVPKDIIITGLDGASITVGEYTGDDIVISIEDATVELHDITFANTSYTAIAVGSGAEATISGCTFDNDSMDNTQKTIHTYGGAVVTITDCTFANLAGYGSQSISSYDSHVTVDKCTFDNVTQAVMAQKTSNTEFNSKLTVKQSTFENVDYAIFTISGGEVAVVIDDCSFDEVAVFVANNSGTFAITNNTFVVGEHANSDPHFKNTTASDMTIDKTNTIVGEAKFGDNVVDGTEAEADK